MTRNALYALVGALTVVPRVEVTSLIKVIVNFRVNGCEYLQTAHPPEVEHGSFLSSKRQL